MSEEWEYRPVSEIADHRLGKMLDKRKNKGDFRQYIRNVNVRWFSFDLSDLKEMRFTDDECEKYEIEKGDLVVCEGGYPGRAAIWQDEETIFFQKALHRIRFHEQERNEWFLYYLFYLDSSGRLKSYFTGAGIQHFTGQTLAKLNVPLPPLAEQRRIVSILDEAFGAIAKAKENVEKNLANAKELFESYLNKVFTEKGAGWEETTVGDQMTLQRGFDITKKQQKPGNVPVVSSGGIKSHHDTSKVSAPCVVLGRKGSVGSVYYVEEDFWPHDTTLWVKDFKGNSELLAYYMFRGLDLKTLDSGAANPALNRNNVHPIEIFWPMHGVDQSVIGSRLQSLEREVEVLDALYQQKLTDLDELKQSILQKAFTGRLTSKSPELESI